MERGSSRRALLDARRSVLTAPSMDHTTAVTLTALPPRHAVRITGRHRLRFLHAMTSAGLLKATPGDARFATMSTASGKHLGQMTLEVSDDHVTLAGPPESVARVVAGLAAHRVADDVRWGEAVPRQTLVLSGATREALERLASGVLPAVPAPGRFEDAGSVRASLWDAIVSEVGTPTLRLEVSGEEATENARDLRERLLAAGASEGSEAAWEAARIANAWPDDARELPAEESTLASRRLVANVDWQKGCFLGQEAFVMARDRGEAPRRVVAARVTGELPALGSAILRGEDPVARVSSASSGPDGAVVLTVLRRKHADDPQDLRLEDGRALTLLP
jgi:folate-binding protein YgfZ